MDRWIDQCGGGDAARYGKSVCNARRHALYIKIDCEIVSEAFTSSVFGTPSEQR